MLDLKSPVLVAHQPEYFPWLGFIAKAQLADVYYIVDTVQYMKEHWHSRNKIRKKDGWLWINTPVLQSKSKILMWPEAKIDNTKPWKRKQLSSIQMCYSRAKYFKEIYAELEGHDISGIKTDLILNMCKAANAKTFIFGQDGKTYIEEDKFKQSGVEYKFQNFKHPIYKQRHPKFESHMSFIDLLFNHGDNSIEILKQI